MVGDAVKVTLVPEQMAPDGLAAMLTLAATFGFTVMMIELEVEGLPVTQVALEIITHFIVSEFESVEVIYEEPVATFVPFLIHR